MSSARYAIYFVPPPDDPLYRFGATALGYDCHAGEPVASLSGEGFSAAEWHELTAEPRRYGFHATLKPPFRLRAEYSERDLVAQFHRIAPSYGPPFSFPASVALLGSFAAFLPRERVAALHDLADACVRDFDTFRAPPSDAERARRLASPLTGRQREHLDRWGYPFVFEDFRFHMTLTGRILPDRKDAVLAFLQAALVRMPVPDEIAVGSITLLRQDRPDAQFRVIESAALQAASAASAPR